MNQVQVIDVPYRPIKPQKPRRRRSFMDNFMMLLGAFAAGLLVAHHANLMNPVCEPVTSRVR